MAKRQFRRGPKLFSLARKKALQLDIPQEKGIKLGELITRIQKKEGSEPCFGRRARCDEQGCLWQGSCGAEMQPG